MNITPYVGLELMIAIPVKHTLLWQIIKKVVIARNAIQVLINGIQLNHKPKRRRLKGKEGINMKVIEKGHIYQPKMRNEFNLEVEKVPDFNITFINKEKGREHNGTTTQEVIRILIDRTRHCANCMPHPNNERIVYHLRMALVLHEARALERKTEKGYFNPEYLDTGDDGHIDLTIKNVETLDTPELIPYRHDWDRVCTHEGEK